MPSSHLQTVSPKSNQRGTERPRRVDQPCIAVLGASMPRVVLIVEDEAILLVLAVSVLEAAGYDTVSAGTVAEALAIIENPEQKLDLLFTDLGLGDLTDGGLAVGQTMAKSRPGLPVVYTSGRGVTDCVVKQFVEPSEFIPKPYTDKQLVSTAVELLNALGSLHR
jgi:DNA-binding NtrC family response regulator